MGCLRQDAVVTWSSAIGSASAINVINSPARSTSRMAAPPGLRTSCSRGWQSQASVAESVECDMATKNHGQA